MFISGLQKLTLLDYPGRVACTVFTAGCSFRCPFCHNASLVLPERLSEDVNEDTVLKYLERRRGVLDGVAVTGGEPLLHPELPDFLRKVKAMGYPVKLDTNGSFPDRLRSVVEAGLVDRVAMDIKNAPEQYGRTVGHDGFDLRAVDESREYLMSGAVEYEFRTTAVKGLHTEESIAAAAKWIAGAREYYLQQYKDSGDILHGNGLSAFDAEEMASLQRAAARYVPGVSLRGVQ